MVSYCLKKHCGGRNTLSLRDMKTGDTGTYIHFDSRHEAGEHGSGDHHHSSTHYINVKFGYYLFFLSIAHAIAIWAYHRVFFQRPRKPLLGFSALPWVNFPLVLSVGAWLAISLAILCYSGAYAIAIKRFGRLSYALVPFDIFLALRPNIPPIPYLSTLDLHKWVSRLIILYGLMHGIGYLVKWGLEGVFGKTFLLLNLLGLVVFILFIPLLVISARYFRRKYYRTFYALHNITLFVFLGLITFHARPGVLFFTSLSVLLLIYQVFCRVFRVCTVQNVEIISLDYSSLLIARISKPTDYHYFPGDHLRLTYSPTNFKAWIFPTHPYTIASFPDEPYIDLVLRLPSSFYLGSDCQYSISYLYTTMNLSGLKHAKSVHLVAGGTGISFILPVAKLLLSWGVFFSTTWVTRNKYDLHILKALNVKGNIDTYITGATEKQNKTSDPEEAHGLMSSAESENVELEDLSATKEEKPSGSSLKFGRPPLKDILNYLTEGDVLKNWVITAGPHSLVSEIETWGKLNGVGVLSELYEM